MLRDIHLYTVVTLLAYSILQDKCLFIVIFLFLQKLVQFLHKTSTMLQTLVHFLRKKEKNLKSRIKNVLVVIYYVGTTVQVRVNLVLNISGYPFSKSPSGRSSISTPTPSPYTLTACNGCQACKVRMHTIKETHAAALSRGYLCIRRPALNSFFSLYCECTYQTTYVRIILFVSTVRSTSRQ